MASSQTISTCASCSKTSTETTLMQCSKCHNVKYCSTECQRANWKDHKLSCKVPKKPTPARRPFEDMLPGVADAQITVPINADNPRIVEFGPVTTVGELRAAEPGPKRRYEDKLYDPTPKQIYDHCQEILKNHEKSKKEGKDAAKKGEE